MTFPVSRTHVVDLGRMPREQVIEIAKKQAGQICEKNIRITAMEELIENLTGNPVSEVLATTSSVAATAAAATWGSSGSRAGSVSKAGGGGTGDFTGMGGFALSSPSPLGEPSVRHGSPGSSASFHAGSHLAADLQEAMEDERLQFVTQLSLLEESLREKETGLAAKTAELAALQEKVNDWKTKVMATSRVDQERIESLTKQLAALSRGGGAASAFEIGSTAGQQQEQQQQQPNAPPHELQADGEADESQQQRDPKANAPASEMNAGSENNARSSQLRSELQRLEQANAALRKENDALANRRGHTSSEPTAAVEPSGQGSEQGTANSSQVPSLSHSVPMSDAAAAAAVEAAVQAKLDLWRARFTQTLPEQQSQIASLEQQLAQAHQQLQEKQQQSAPAASMPTGAPAMADLFGLPSPAPTPLPDSPTAESLQFLQHPLDALREQNTPLQAANERLEQQLQFLEGHPQQQQTALQSASAAERNDPAAADGTSGGIEKPCKRCEVLEGQLLGLRAAAETALARQKCFAAREFAAVEAADAAEQAQKKAEAKALAPCEQCEALRTRLAEWKAKAKDVITEAQAAREALEEEAAALRTRAAEQDAALQARHAELAEARTEAQRLSVDAGTAAEQAAKAASAVAGLRAQLTLAEVRTEELERQRSTSSAEVDGRVGEIKVDVARSLEAGLLGLHAKVRELQESSLLLKEENIMLRRSNVELQQFKSELVADLARRTNEHRASQTS